MTKIKEVEFEPGWLERECHRAEIDMMTGHSRAYWQQGPKLNLPFPTSWDKAEELLSSMSKNFKSWTGRSIEEHIKARPKE